MRKTKAASTAIIFLIGAVAASCDLGSALLTEDEIGGLYDIRILDERAALVDGSAVSAALPLSLAVTALDGAPDAESLTVELADSAGAIVASVSYDNSASGTKDVTSTNSFLSNLQPFTLPDDLENGYYTLTVTLRDGSGAELSASSVTVLALDKQLEAPVIAVYPGLAKAGAVSLLKLEWTVPTGLDPWIRWTVDGTIVAEGYASARADRLAWSAPATNGVHSAIAEAFPFRPPEGTAPPAPVRGVARIPISTNDALVDPWSAADSWSILALDGTFADSGPRLRSDEPEGVSEPYLETYATGFGYALGDGRAVRSASSLLPLNPESGLPVEFAFTLLLASLPGSDGPGDGTIFSSAAADGRLVFSIGISEGVPYAESSGVKVAADTQLPSGPSRLAARIYRDQSSSIVEFFVDDVMAGAGRLPLSIFQTLPGASTIGGNGGYAAIYDELRILRGAYPAFAIARAYEAGERLIAASGFEGGGLGSGLSISGEGSSLLDGSLVLSGDASLDVTSAGLSTYGVTVSLAMKSGVAVALLPLADGSNLEIYSDGRISAASIDQASGLRIADGERFSFSIRPTASGAELYGLDGSMITVPIGFAADAALRFRAETGGRTEIESALATRFEQPKRGLEATVRKTDATASMAAGWTVALALPTDH